MAFHLRNLFFSLTFILLTSLTAGDDSAVMTKLSASLSPAPPSWTGNNFCKWDGIMCDKSNRVISINLQSKSLTGTLPSEINQLSQLQTLAVERNSISGDLPTLANLTNLRQIFLDSNNFASIPPDFFSGLNGLQIVSISDNPDLSPWSIPETLDQSDKLHSFLASNAKITGNLPEIFDRLYNLQNLRLSYNNLTGKLPESFAGSQIQNLLLNNQLLGLSGTLDVISSMNQVNQVWLHVNSFTGVIPDLSNCTVLFDLQIRDNELTGLVPKTVMSLPKLANISLRNNKLQGQLPVFRSGVFAELGIKTNSFCLSTPGPCDPQVTSLLEVAGEIGFPMILAESWKGNDACKNWAFVSCDVSRKNVTIVTFVKRNFSGSISPAFANLSSLRVLSLNGNNLAGSIPEILTSLPDLQLLDVSNNNLSGPIPVFPPRVRFLHSGNPFLGQNVANGSGQNVSNGRPGNGSGSGNMGGHRSSHRKTKRASVRSDIVAGIVSGVVVMVIITVWLVCCGLGNLNTNNQNVGNVPAPDHGLEMVNPGPNPERAGGLQSDQGSSVHTEMSVSGGGNVAIDFRVLRDITNCFSEENVLGKGGSAVVYRGTLDDGTKVAVKRMDSSVMRTQGLSEFRAEIAALSKLRHRHIVALFGYCIDGNEKLLVYEYMSQGTLSQHLFEWKERKTSPLSWKQRASVALDVARGVEYLHNLVAAGETYIHRDLKPSNILLGDNLVAKLADFGLVKNAPNPNHSVETKVAGTFGYLAPEYVGSGKVTAKADVFAFGVMLMELITGRAARDKTVPDDEWPMVPWFRNKLVSKEEIIKATDQTLDTGDDETVESICKVAKLARQCTATEHYDRPDMGHVVTVLGPLVEQWKPAQLDEDGDKAIGEIINSTLHKMRDGVGSSRTVDDLRGDQASSSSPRNA
ncbi:hypothetical protein SSX86_012824 [Deinandra increscens subsp. villosa]|uniref:Protein kinase domain-containing protein n=1 Tax=Deinandra increscens subsp. villosa TaxID=3103831 RepID=A0AAP0DCH8_9ASTR